MERSSGTSDEGSRQPVATVAAQVVFCYTVASPGRVWPSREFGYLISSARTRITSATTNRQSMAIVMATRIQDDFSSNRPHLLCVGTARRSFSRPADRRPALPGRSSTAAAPTRANEALPVYRLNVTSVLSATTQTLVRSELLYAPTGSSPDKISAGVAPRWRRARRLSASWRFASRTPVASTTSRQWNQPGASSPSAR